MYTIIYMVIHVHEEERWDRHTRREAKQRNTIILHDMISLEAGLQKTDKMYVVIRVRYRYDTRLMCAVTINLGVSTIYYE